MKIVSLKFQYFNQEQNLYITAEGENLIPKFDRAIELEKGQTMHIGENDHGVVNFGLWYDNPNKRPGHGGFWSSRESIVGPLIGKRLVSVAINGVGASMTYEALTEILPEEYHIVPKVHGSKDLKIKSSAEVSYHIQRKDGMNEDTPYNEIPMLAPSYRYGT